MASKKNENENTTILSGKKVIVLDKKFKDQLQQKGFGEKEGKKLLLSLTEALYLFEKEKIIIENAKGREISEKDLLKECSKEKNFYSKFIVFKDFRDRGFVTKTGFKFGFDFRVYPRGKKPGEEHTQWVVQVKSQENTCSWPEFSRMVRLSGNLKTTFLQAVVDSEGSVNYYEIKRITP